MDHGVGGVARVYKVCASLFCHLRTARSGVVVTSLTWGVQAPALLRSISLDDFFAADRTKKNVLHYSDELVKSMNAA